MPPTQRRRPSHKHPARRSQGILLQALPFDLPTAMRAATLTQDRDKERGEQRRRGDTRGISHRQEEDGQITLLAQEEERLPKRGAVVHERETRGVRRPPHHTYTRTRSDARTRGLSKWAVPERRPNQPPWDELTE